jgi:hypothetical protein
MTAAGKWRRAMENRTEKDEWNGRCSRGETILHINTKETSDE